MLVKLTYFKKSGKYYSEGMYNTNHTFIHEVLSELVIMARNNDMPGLMNWYNDFIILVEFDYSKFLIPNGLDILQIKEINVNG